MDIPTEGLSAGQAYKLLIGSVVPRPIAWITSINESGLVNLAPFSAFTWVCQEPPMIGVAIARRAGALKDTAQNAVTHGSFVVNIASEALLEAMHLSSGDYPPDVSEVEELNLALSPSVAVDVPRLADAPIALECTFYDALEFGTAGQQFMIGHIVSFHVRDDLYVNGKIDSEDLRPIARLAGPTYAHLGEIIRAEPVHVSSRNPL